MLEDFAIRPVAGQTLKITQLLGVLRQQPCVLELSAKCAIRSTDAESVYVICGDEQQQQRISDWTKQGNTLAPFIGSVAILEVTAAYVSVYQPAPEQVVRKVQELLLPLLRTQQWRLFSERGEETDRFRDHPSQLFSVAGTLSPESQRVLERMRGEAAARANLPADKRTLIDNPRFYGAVGFEKESSYDEAEVPDKKK